MPKEPEAKHRLGPQRNPAIDAAVLEATRQLLVEKGYAGTSIDAIATLAGVGRPAIYRRWPSKAHIVNEAIYPVLDAEEGADLTELGTEGTIADQIRALVQGAVALFASPATRAAAPGLMSEVRTNGELREVLVVRQLAGVRVVLKRRLEAARERGEIRDGVDADTLLDIMAGAAIFALSVRDVDDPGPLAESLADIVLRGILPPGQ
ncbi:MULTISPECIES: TetR/AcrR family transcriptional regulator [unclassified Rhodococcus (in: high G+C Gram-positive bacteria)]|uniref:TetR/AcrR family transcriptional regulator n=1 Tax=unclassified Rhodococcus (in: high G+C Gram-positive bacteria) TaxID=192944 RepID=UPI000BC40377|nr:MULTISPECIES: TetR/AcrR family transcriptional regulator [unclassified Rhodococcus (in: high G+C Gram-positive bacteria)]MBP1161901.1 AcrR family transcriptional regulator [Rhodococcus sp. PvR099]PTR43389.1 TetR family transcriptional regulator [Rhodococcus sp. OK611]SNX91252.1 transcriptional regulator, TetR family [Rhodococcus sp. OK270]